MSAREELARDICRSLDRIFGTREMGPANQDYKLADALLAEGYVKPRTVTTIEELDALPIDSIVRECDGFKRFKLPGGKWVLMVYGATAIETSDYLDLPAEVLHEPQP